MAQLDVICLQLAQIASSIAKRLGNSNQNQDLALRSAAFLRRIKSLQMSGKGQSAHLGLRATQV
jgi:hypothetical protein